MTVLARGRLHIAAMCVGTAQRILDESVAHASASKQGGRPIGDYQLVQAMLADSYAEIAAGRSLVLHGRGRLRRRHGRGRRAVLGQALLQRDGVTGR